MQAPNNKAVQALQADNATVSVMASAWLISYGGLASNTTLPYLRPAGMQCKVQSGGTWLCTGAQRSLADSTPHHIAVHAVVIMAVFCMMLLCK